MKKKIRSERHECNVGVWEVIVGETDGGWDDDNKLGLKIMWLVTPVSMIHVEECVAKNKATWFTG